jgi:hypothetical protein
MRYVSYNECQTPEQHSLHYKSGAGRLLAKCIFFKYKPVKNMFDDFVIVVPGGELVHFFFTPQDATSGILQ